MSDAKTTAAAAAPAKHVLIPIGNGSEDIEAVCLIDVLRRAGLIVTVASVESSLQITAARQTKIVADALMDDTTIRSATYDGIFCPGGMPGAERLRDSKALIEALKAQSTHTTRAHCLDLALHSSARVLV